MEHQGSACLFFSNIGITSTCMPSCLCFFKREYWSQTFDLILLDKRVIDWAVSHLLSPFSVSSFLISLLHLSWSPFLFHGLHTDICKYTHISPKYIVLNRVPCIRETTQNLSVWIWLIVFKIMVSSCIHFLTNIINSFFFKVSQNSTVYFLIHLSVNGQQGQFCFLGIMKSAAINTVLQVHLRCVAWSGWMIQCNPPSFK